MVQLAAGWGCAAHHTAGGQAGALHAAVRAAPSNTAAHGSTATLLATASSTAAGLAAALATALLRADRATTGADHGVRGGGSGWVYKKIGWKVWKWESACLHPLLYPAEGLLSSHTASFPCYCLC